MGEEKRVAGRHGTLVLGMVSYTHKGMKEFNVFKLIYLI